jgi:hypothetical protein
MTTIKIQIKSNHEDGDSIENIIYLNLNEAILGKMVNLLDIDWIILNTSILSYPNYIILVKEQLRLNRIEIPDPNWWTSTGIVVGVNNVNIPSDYDFFLIEEKIMTGDFLD